MRSFLSTAWAAYEAYRARLRDGQGGDGQLRVSPRFERFILSEERTWFCALVTARRPWNSYLSGAALTGRFVACRL